MTRCKAGMSNMLTVVGLIVQPSTAIAKPKDSLEAYIFICKTTVKGTSSNTVISTSLYIFFSFSNILRSNSISHQIICKQ